MKKILTSLFATGAVLALAACGSAEDASVDAEAENVEISADEALSAVEETPVADPAATASEAAEAPAGEGATKKAETEAEDAGAAAEAAVADIEAITGAAEKAADATE